MSPKNTTPYTLSQFDYYLPKTRIARYPLKDRSGSRLLCIDRHALHTQTYTHHYFHQLAKHLPSNSLLVFNDTRVIPAHIQAHKQSGGHVSLLIERVIDAYHAQAFVRANKPIKLPCVLKLNDTTYIEMIDRKGESFHIRTRPPLTISDLFKQFGSIPLPPYLKRQAETIDTTRYQTIYAKTSGAVAAPTAGLHFDQPLLDAIAQKGIESTHITLHVGAGTFKPIRTQMIEQHTMHRESIVVPTEACEKIKTAKAEGKRIIAVGTTTLRCLEAVSQSGTPKPFHGETDLFIKPGYPFRCVDGLITNFHLPQSTLLILVCAFAGFERTMQAYKIAIDQGYRFYSYGDSMLIL